MLLRSNGLIRRVACAMSGGVDSAVSAALLKQRGYEVIAVFMQNWDQTNEKGECMADLDREDATYVCDKLQIPLRETNFVKEYWNDVFSEMISGYESGTTPNPDVLCNKYIKFGAFYDHVMSNMDVDALATGHYAQNSYGNFLEHKHEGNAKLLMAHDRWKDQTLFLAQMSQHALQNTMFPIGNLYKKGVKTIAESLGLERIVKKKESVGICFIGSRKFDQFIEEYIVPKPGNFIDVETGEVIGRHKGTHYWTIGQRSNIGGAPVGYFIARLDPRTQNVYVAPGSYHPALYCDSVYTDEPHWIREPPDEFKNTGSYQCDFKFQHVYKFKSCKIERTNAGSDSNCVNSQEQWYKMTSFPGDLSKKVKVKVTTEVPIRALTPGQYMVYYKDNECLGSSKILTLGPSLHEQGVSGAGLNRIELEMRIV